jgi:hypothetical protein
MIHENILYGYDYDTETNTLIGRLDIENYGFFSTFTLMITSIMEVYKKYGTTPDRINGTNLLKKLKKNKQIDMYNYFFYTDNSIDINFIETQIPVPYGPNDQYTIYTEDNIKFYKPFFKKYFNPKKNITDKIKFLIENYNINIDKTVSVIYRDSDKWIDFGGLNYLSAGPYLKKCKSILGQNLKIDQVLIQSENMGVVKTFSDAFGAKFFWETSINKCQDEYPPIPEDEEKILDWSEFYIASLWICSKCNHVITYTGNSSFFVYLNRGTTKNLTQELTFTKNHEDFFITN